MDIEFTENDVVIDYEWGRTHLLARILDLKIDQDENIYLADAKRAGVIKISPSGTLLAEIGGRGQGPGEFREPSRLFLSRRNDLYVFDSQSRKIVKFDDRGAYVNRIPIRNISGFPPPVWTDFFVDYRGHTFLVYRELIYDKSSFHSVFEIDARGNSVRTVARFLEESMEKGLSSGGGVMGSAIHQYTPRVFLSSSGPHFYFGCSDDSRIIMMNNLGEEVQVVVIADKTVPISAEEKKHFEHAFRNHPGMLKLPDARPLYSNLLCDETDRLYLVRTKSVLDKTPGAIIDVLSAEGDFLSRIRSPIAPHAVRFGRIYAVELNDLGEYRILSAEIPGVSSWKD
ncbi:MAG: 6-bladed beta-propeller [Acidobacteriota bacterium]|nr:6-bladed beta-propeller [Acidobacteriota bacterium]